MKSLFKSNKFLRFLVSGALAACTEYLIFAIISMFIEVRLVFIPQTISYVGGFIVSFILQRKWVFESTGQINTELGKYAILASINIVLTNLVMSTLVNIIHTDMNISKIIVMGMVAAWNYVIFNKLIFKTSAETKEKVEE